MLYLFYSLFSHVDTTRERLYFHLKVLNTGLVLHVTWYLTYPGRLYQIEYAMEAIERAGTCLGILASDGVVLAAEKKNTNKLLDETVFFEKIYQLDKCVGYQRVVM